MASINGISLKNIVLAPGAKDPHQGHAATLCMDGVEIGLVDCLDPMWCPSINFSDSAMLIDPEILIECFERILMYLSESTPYTMAELTTCMEECDMCAAFIYDLIDIQILEDMVRARSELCDKYMGCVVSFKPVGVQLLKHKWDDMSDTIPARLHCVHMFVCIDDAVQNRINQYVTPGDEHYDFEVARVYRDLEDFNIGSQEYSGECGAVETIFAVDMVSPIA